MWSDSFTVVVVGSDRLTQASTYICKTNKARNSYNMGIQALIIMKAWQGIALLWSKAKVFNSLSALIEIDGIIVKTYK